MNMRMRLQFTVLFLALAVCEAQNSARAAFIGMPKGLGAAIHQIKLTAPTLPPMAFTRFCMQYAAECKSRRIVFRGGRAKLSSTRWAELVKVNREVNLAIEAQPNYRGVAFEEWLIAPARGDCNDYAVTKRHLLMRLGWAPRNLLLSEVVTAGGEHHLVLVVRTTDGDVVLDSLSPQIRNWSAAPYRWVRMQTAINPKFWATVAV